MAAQSEHPRALVMSEKALANSSGPRTSMNCGCTPSARAATSAAFSMSFAVRSPRATGSRRTATRSTPGTVCLRSSRRLPSSSAARVDNPVTLPPGRARLVTSPLPTGSPATKTMGIVLVACMATRGPSVPPSARMTSTLSTTSSAARAGSRSRFPSASRYSTTTLRPST